MDNESSCISVSSFSPNTIKSSEVSYDSSNETCSNEAKADEDLPNKINSPTQPKKVLAARKSFSEVREKPSDEKTDNFRKRVNTWPLKASDKNYTSDEFDEELAKKLSIELGLESGKQLKNPWGNLSYSQLIERAIESSPWKSLSLKEIYAWFIKYVPYFKDKSNYKSTMGWKNSIRHNLSLHKRFIRVGIFHKRENNARSLTKPVKFVWTSLKYKPKTPRMGMRRPGEQCEDSMSCKKRCCAEHGEEMLKDDMMYAQHMGKVLSPNQMPQARHFANPLLYHQMNLAAGYNFKHHAHQHHPHNENGFSKCLCPVCAVNNYYNFLNNINFNLNNIPPNGKMLNQPQMNPLQSQNYLFKPMNIPQNNKLQTPIYPIPQRLPSQENAFKFMQLLQNQSFNSSIDNSALISNLIAQNYQNSLLSSANHQAPVNSINKSKIALILNRNAEQDLGAKQKLYFADKREENVSQSSLQENLDFNYQCFKPGAENAELSNSSSFFKTLDQHNLFQSEFSNDSSNNADQASYNYKRKLMDRYNGEDGTQGSQVKMMKTSVTGFKKIPVDNEKQLNENDSANNGFKERNLKLAELLECNTNFKMLKNIIKN